MIPRSVSNSMPGSTKLDPDSHEYEKFFSRNNIKGYF